MSTTRAEIIDSATGECERLSSRQLDLAERTEQASVCQSSLKAKMYRPQQWHWKTNPTGHGRDLQQPTDCMSHRQYTSAYVRFLDDFPCNAYHQRLGRHGNGQLHRATKIYVVQTNTKVIERCLLMTTDPGDLVLDPTCGSGTTAYVAEQWGRRWITIDTSRVAIALARQRLLTAKYDYYEIRDRQDQARTCSRPARASSTRPCRTSRLNPSRRTSARPDLCEVGADAGGRSWQRSTRRWQTVTPEIRAKLAAKLAEKERREGKSAITEADRRRWLLPKERVARVGSPLRHRPRLAAAAADGAGSDYREAWRGKMDEVNATIAASAAQEELVDQPKVVPGVLRVSGPFTVEGVQPAEESLDLESPIDGEPEDLGRPLPRRAGEPRTSRRTPKRTWTR